MLLAITMLSAVIYCVCKFRENDYGEYYFYVGDVNMDYILNVADAQNTPFAIGLDVLYRNQLGCSYDRFR